MDKVTNVAELTVQIMTKTGLDQSQAEGIANTVFEQVAREEDGSGVVFSMTTHGRDGKKVNNMFNVEPKSSKESAPKPYHATISKPMDDLSETNEFSSLVNKAYASLSPSEYDAFTDSLMKIITNPKPIATSEESKLIGGVDAVLSLVNHLHEDIHPSPSCETVHEIIDVLLQLRSDVVAHLDSDE